MNGDTAPFAIKFGETHHPIDLTKGREEFRKTAIGFPRTRVSLAAGGGRSLRTGRDGR